MDKNKLRCGIDLVGSFIHSLKKSGFSPAPLKTRQLATFSRSELGGLTIWDDEVLHYRNCIKTLAEAINNLSEVLSESAIEQAVQDTVLKSLDINQNFKDKNFDERLAESIKELGNRLTASPGIWDVYFQVLGVRLKDSCFCFGKFRFLPADKHTHKFLLQQGYEIIQRSSDTDEAKEWSKKHLKKEIKKDLSEGVISWIKVEALDEKAARSNAIEQLNLTLDILNFFTLIVHPRGMEVRAYLPGQAAYNTGTLSIACRQGAQFNAESGLRGPLDLFLLTDLDKSPPARRSLSLLSNILRLNKPNEFQKRLLASVRFAGRATVNRVREESFLQHAIAMESLLSDKDGAGEITFKLAARCAHLIGPDSQSRNDIFKEVKKLYGVRSKIVHRGNTDLTDMQLSRLQYYVRSSLFVILTQDMFDHIEDETKFLAWFDEKFFS